MKYKIKTSLIKMALISSLISTASVSPVLALDKGTALEGAYITDEANDDATVVKSLDIGQIVDILEIKGNFYKIALEGIEEAFVLDKYINVVEADGVVVGDSVIVREKPDSSSESITRFSYGDKVLVNGIVGDYYRINYNGLEAFIHSDYVIGDMIYSVQKIDSEENKESEKTKYGTIIAQTGVNLRKEADENSEVIAVLARNSVLDVIGEEGDLWVEVLFEDESAFINAEYFLVQTGVRPDEPPIVLQTSENNGDKADQIIDYAKKFIGTPYSWGGTNLNRGVDCSGFTYAVMRDNGVYVDRTSRSQSNDGYKVSKSELKKGDLVFFATGGGRTISHVGIYIGDGNFIHSSSGKKRGVTIDSLYSDYYTRTYVTSARVLD